MKTPSPHPCTGASLGLLLRQVRDAMWLRMERELAHAGHELTFSQYMALKALANGTASVTELARCAQLNPGAMTRLLDKLEGRGFVARVADPVDRRALHIDLTDAGRTMWDEVNHLGMRVRERAMHGMSEDDREQFTRLLTLVRDNLSTEE
jgi:DNA-binding MarR family transcriptional regulator